MISPNGTADEDKEGSNAQRSTTETKQTTMQQQQPQRNNDSKMRRRVEKKFKHDVMVVNEWIRTKSTLIDDRNICVSQHRRFYFLF